jgi:cation-transporting ATPase 13A2
MQFVEIDIFLIFPLAITMSYSNPSDELRGKRPEGALISFQVLSSIIGVQLLQGLGIFCAWCAMDAQEWYDPEEDNMNNPGSDENTIMFVFTNV